MGAGLPGAPAQPPPAQTGGASARSPSSTGGSGEARGAGAPSISCLSPPLRPCLPAWGLLAGTLSLWIRSTRRCHSPSPAAQQGGSWGEWACLFVRSPLFPWGAGPSPHRRTQRLPEGADTAGAPGGPASRSWGRGATQEPRTQAELGVQAGIAASPAWTPGLRPPGCERGTVPLPPQGPSSVEGSHRLGGRAGPQAERAGRGALAPAPRERPRYSEEGRPDRLSGGREARERPLPPGRQGPTARGWAWEEEVGGATGHPVGGGARPGADRAPAASGTRLRRAPRRTPTPRPAGDWGPAGV